MFYSTEILGRRSPLGAIWIAAHGKRLNRSKVLSVNIVETCNKIMDPEIPQALRLQGILIGGVAVIFNKQQHYLLDDCNDAMRKVQGLTDQQRAATTLAKDRMRARPEKITIQALDFLGPGVDITDGDLLEDALQKWEPAENTAPGDDFFVMPTLEGSIDVPTPGRDSTDTTDNAFGFTPNSRSSFADINFDAALTLDQPERFDAPEMEMDLPDMGPEPFMSTPDAAQPENEQAGGPGPDMEEAPQQQDDMKVLPADITMDAHMDPLNAPPSPPPEIGGAFKQAGSAQDDGGMQLDGMPLTPALAEEEHPPAAAQARKRGKRKAAGGPILDDIERILVPAKVYREWTLNREPLLTERPKRARVTAESAPFLLLPSPGSGPWPPEILEMLESRTELPQGPGTPEGSKEEQGWGSQGRGDPQAEAEHFTVDMDQWLDAPEQPSPDPMPMDHDMGGSPMEELTGSAELQAVADEEGLSVEQLRAALETPQAAEEQLKSLQQGMASGSSKHSSLASLLARRARTSSKGLTSSGNVPAHFGFESDRSLGSIERRLSDVREQDPPLDFPEDGPRGSLDAPLPALPEIEAEGPEPHQPGMLTQFQLLGESLMEATERQTQPTLQASFNKNTVTTMRVLRQHFGEQEKAEGAAPPLSMNAMTAGMTKRQAAKLFYQICAVASIGCVAAAQEEPYGDILLTPGTRYTQESC